MAEVVCVIRAGAGRHVESTASTYSSSSSSNNNNNNNQVDPNCP